jgi:hypothetical protein
MINKQTTLDLNGPNLSFIQQPQPISVCDGGSAVFVGIATATFPIQDPPNPATNTGTLSYRWYAEGFGPLADGLFQGISITGSGTTTLTVSNVKSPNTNGLRFYVGVDYVPSAYSQPEGSEVTVGTGRSTGNALNEILNSNSAILTVLPSLSVTTQPNDSTVSVNIPATFTTLGALTDTTQGSISYQWQLNGNDLVDGSNVRGSRTPTLSISLPNISTNTIRARLTHPTACNSPLFTNNATFTIEPNREILNIEQVTDGGDFISAESANIYNTSINFVADAGVSGRALSVYVPEKDIRVRITLAGSGGQPKGSVLGGQGGITVFDYTLRRNTEYVFKLGSSTFPTGGANGGGGGAFFYEKARLVVACGGGGGAGDNGRGGDGAGSNLAGQPGQGSGGGAGGLQVPTGSFLSGIDRTSTITAGRVSGCTVGDFYQQQGFSPCQDVGQKKWTGASGIVVNQTATIQRGYKSGRGFRNNGGNGSTGSLISSPVTTELRGTVEHVFDNVNNVHILTQSSPNLAVSYLNPNAPDSLPCSGNDFNHKHYSVQFITPFDDTNYNINVVSISPLTAGGASATNMRVSGIFSKSRFGFRIIFCRDENGVSVNTYIRGFSFICTGNVTTLVNSGNNGGGGSGANGGNAGSSGSSGGGGGSGYSDGSASIISSSIGGNPNINSYVTITHLL